MCVLSNGFDMNEDAKWGSIDRVRALGAKGDNTSAFHQFNASFTELFDRKAANLCAVSNVELEARLGRRFALGLDVEGAVRGDQ